MSMVNIREMRVLMLERCMSVRMRVRFHAIPFKIMDVLVMHIVPVSVPMNQ